MERNKGKRSLDQSTRHTLSALEKALGMTCASPLREDEFTMHDYIEKFRKVNPQASISGLRSRLYLLVKSGEYKTRKITINGKSCNAYSEA